MHRALLGSLQHGYHSPALLWTCHCPHTTNKETRPERRHSLQKVNGKVKIQSPFFIKFSKPGSEERWRASKLITRETKIRRRKKRHSNYETSSSQIALKTSMQSEDTTLENILKWLILIMVLSHQQRTKLCSLSSV